MDFFDQNPLSQLSFVATFRERAVLLSDFVDSPMDHVYFLLYIAFRLTDLIDSVTLKVALLYNQLWTFP